MTVVEARRRISSREFSDWMAFYELEPWGEIREPMDPAKKRQQLAYEAMTAFGLCIQFAGSKK